MSQEEILGLADFDSVKPGWGWNQIVQIEGMPVFLEGIPLTDLESGHPDSTRNLYSLPR